MRKKGVCLLGVVAGLFFAGCEPVARSFKDTFKPDEETRQNGGTVVSAVGGEQPDGQTSGKRANYVLDTLYLETAERQLKALPRFKGKAVILYNLVYFYGNGNIDTYVQDPDEPRYVDQYHYTEGSWQEPQPKQMSVEEEKGIPGKIFPLAGFSFGTATKMLQAYNEKVKGIVGAKPEETVYYIHGSPYTSWYPSSIDGTREKWTILFNADASIKRFERN